MHSRTIDHTIKALLLLSLLLIVVSACKSTRSTRILTKNQALLRKNTIKINPAKVLRKKSDTKDNLNHIVQQRPNSYALGLFPVKLWLYNSRYKKYQADTSNFQLKSKTVEKPVIFDTSLMNKSAQDMKSYMYNQGFFYAHVTDTFHIKKKKAYVTYNIDPGFNYSIKTVTYDADDKTAGEIIKDEYDASGLQAGKQFTMSMLEDERSHVAAVLRDHGYYHFTQDNVTFQLDTVNKSLFHDVENPLESALYFLKTENANKKPTLDITVRIRPSDENDTLVYVRYGIGHIRIFPDFKDAGDFRDTSNLVEKVSGDVTIKYHDYYVNEHVITRHLYLTPGRYYSQSDYDKTITQLNELGIFQYIRIVFTEDKKDRNKLNCTIVLNRTKKHDVSTSFEVSNGSTYTLGSSLSLSFRDRNIAKGANLFTATVNGGVETGYNPDQGNDLFEHFFILTRYYGLNTSLDFPKFLSPIGKGAFSSSNVPHTVIGIGTNLIDRLDYFTLINTSAYFTYNWKETREKSWSLSPAFINVISLHSVSDSFQTRLKDNAFLNDSYKPTFIEGENISFTYSDMEKKRGQNYSFVKLGFEEAGGLLTALNSLSNPTTKTNTTTGTTSIGYAQYTKFDFDFRHYFTRPHSAFAFRFYGGVGVPYGQNPTLPYVKQYFVGGPYSLRGWRIRSLGPGSYYDASNASNSDFIDRTGDIKLEWNGEYRFFIMQMFAGAVKLNGALFFDAGNIWLSEKDKAYPGGEFSFNTLGQDIAADLGTGARFDIASFLTLRVDFAFPVKEPYVPTNGGWVFNQLNPADPTWRSNNLIFNLSIGYPF